MNGIEIMFKESNWKIPKLTKGDQVRFNYWTSDFTHFCGYRGMLLNIRYLSSKPLKDSSKSNEITRGNVQYMVMTSRGPRSFYNQRMSNLEKIPRKRLTSLESGV